MVLEIPVMVCFDNNYCIPAGVALYSMLKHADKKTLKDAGDKIAADKKKPVEDALKALKDELAKNPPAPIADIKAKEEALMKAMEPVAQEMYASAQAAQQAQQPGGASEPPKADEPKKEKGGDDVVDADFTMK